MILSFFSRQEKNIKEFNTKEQHSKIEDVFEISTVKASNFVILLGENIFCGKLSYG
jgi:hypothetical protein